MDFTVIFIKGRDSQRNTVSKSFIEKQCKGRIKVADNSVESLSKAIREVKTQNVILINSSHISRKPLISLLEINKFAYQVSTLAVRYIKGVKCPSTLSLAGRTKNIIKIFNNIKGCTNNRNLKYLIGLSCKREKINLAGYAGVINRELHYYIWSNDTIRYRKIPTKYISDKIDKVDLKSIFIN